MKKKWSLTKSGGAKTKEFFKQGCQNSKFNHLLWTDEIFRIDEIKIRFDKIWVYQNEGIPSNKDTKI